MLEVELSKGQNSEAFRLGRSTGLGIAALALSVVSFLSLLGAEKAILAIVLGALAARGSAPAALARRFGIAAICIGTVFLLTLALVLAVYWGKVIELIQLLQKLS